MSTKYFLPSLKIFLVSYDTSFWIWAESSTETWIVIDIFQNVEWNTRLTFIVWFLHIPFIKKELQFFSRNLENGLAQSFVALISAEQWLRISCYLIMLLLHRHEIIVSILIQVSHLIYNSWLAIISNLPIH